MVFGGIPGLRNGVQVSLQGRGGARGLVTGRSQLEPYVFCYGVRALSSY